MAKRNPQYDWLDAPLKNTWELENTAKKKLYDANIFQQLYPNPAPTAAPQRPKTGGLDTGSGWKGFGVNNPDKTDWKENAPANLAELTVVQPSQPQPITHQKKKKKCVRARCRWKFFKNRCGTQRRPFAW